MASFSGVTFVLLCFVFVFMLSLNPRPFVQSFLVRRRPDSHTCFFLFSFSLFGDVASSYFFCAIAVFSLYGEYVVRFPIPDGVFLPCDHGLDFRHQLIMRKFNQSINQSIIVAHSVRCFTTCRFGVVPVGARQSGHTGTLIFHGRKGVIWQETENMSRHPSEGRFEMDAIVNTTRGAVINTYRYSNNYIL